MAAVTRFEKFTRGCLGAAPEIAQANSPGSARFNQGDRLITG
jgi:hypothetical protein